MLINYPSQPNSTTIDPINSSETLPTPKRRKISAKKSIDSESVDDEEGDVSSTSITTDHGSAGLAHLAMAAAHPSAQISIEPNSFSKINSRAELEHCQAELGAAITQAQTDIARLNSCLTTADIAFKKVSDMILEFDRVISEEGSNVKSKVGSLWAMEVPVTSGYVSGENRSTEEDLDELMSGTQHSTALKINLRRA